MTTATKPGPLATIKTAIRAELKATGRTQKDLAQAAGISEKHVSQILTGTVKGDPEMLASLAAAVGLSLDVAVPGSGSATVVTGGDINRLFGERVHYERTRRGWTMRWLASAAGEPLNASTVMRAEKGATDIWLSTACRLAATLEISLDGLVAREPCAHCHGTPPGGFICTMCGRGAA